MIKTKISTAVAAFALALGLAGSASAFTISAGNFKLTIDNFDAGTTGYSATGPGAPFGQVCSTIAECNAASGINTAPGSGATGMDTMGIFSIAAIQDSHGVTTWTRGQGGQFITGLFYNLFDTSVSIDSVGGAPNTNARATGGKFAIYVNAADYNPTLGPTGAGVDLTNGIYPGITGGSLYLSGIFGSGILAGAGDLTTTYRSFFDASLTGTGSGYLEATGGVAKDMFDTNSLTDGAGGKHDMLLTTTFDTLQTEGWTVGSSGQIKGAVVPEPGSLALAALALLGVGIAKRRRS